MLKFFKNTKNKDAKRTVFINLEPPEAYKKKFCSNQIDTSKYNIFTFIFKFLFEQFQKYSNIFFLCISLLDQIDSVSPTGRFTTLTPFLLILTVSAVKEIFEDLGRKKSDIVINNKKIKVLKTTEWKEKKWKDLKVGEVVRVESNELFPADLLFLTSSEENSICFLETSNLDGETNLKIRQSLKDTSHLTTIEGLNSFQAEIEYEQPNRNLYEFVGNLKLADNKTVPLGPNQILLRGSRLCNTHWIYGIVIYTGHETKLMKNSSKASLKRSQIDRATNYQIFFLFIVLLVTSLLSTVVVEIWNRKESVNHWYIGFEDDTDKFMFNFITFVLLYNNLIPISLTVTLEMVRFLQAFFINWDLEMYDEENDYFASARTSNLNEELGLVRYVFSDKTGTLTRNQMELRSCSIAGISYGTSSQSRATWEELIQNLNNHPNSNLLEEFLTILAICHTVIPEKNEENLYDTTYQASSPDENAFITQMKNIGIIFHTRQFDKLTINFLGEERNYEILNVLEFNSVRKRMSVIVKDDRNVIKLFCKGADNVIMERLSRKGQDFKEATLNHLEEFASDGFRTLVLAYKIISTKKYQEWKETYDAASTCIEGRDDKIQEAAELIETNLTILGATAVEDKLQEGVPETIEKLKIAGIKLWVLTGDKLETAVNIGFSCKLLSDETKLIYFVDSNQDTGIEIEKWFEYFTKKEQNEAAAKFGMIIEGKVIEELLSEKWAEKFFKIAISCHVVICCRATPKNKAQIVDLIKYRTKDITLAIGDGANDVSMIRAAHVGIGICGREGTQALAASDYSIGQFRFLARLLFVHGTWNYQRIAKVILYSFYKNAVLYMIELWFAIFNGFSGQILFDRWLIGLYNVIFTAVPPLAIGLFDRPTKASTMHRYPELYSVESKKKDFNMIAFWTSIAYSVVHSAFIFFFCFGILSSEIAFFDGQIGDYIYMGNYVYTCCVLVVCLKAGLETDSWTMMSHISIWGSLIFWFLFFVVYSYAWPIFDVGAEMTRMVENTFRSALYWFSIILIPITILTIDITIKTMRLTFFKTLYQEVREAEMNDLGQDSNPLDFISSKYRANSMKFIRKLTAPIRYLGFAFSQEENGPVNQTEMIYTRRTVWK